MKAQVAELNAPKVVIHAVLMEECVQKSHLTGWTIPMITKHLTGWNFPLGRIKLRERQQKRRHVPNVEGNMSPNIVSHLKSSVLNCNKNCSTMCCRSQTQRLHMHTGESMPKELVCTIDMVETSKISDGSDWIMPKEVQEATNLFKLDTGTVSEAGI